MPNIPDQIERPLAVGYLLDMNGMSDEQIKKMLGEAPKLVDSHRLEKLEKIKPIEKKLECLGAGLLLQKVMLEDYRDSLFFWKDSKKLKTAKNLTHMCIITLNELLEELNMAQEIPFEPVFTYGEGEKPYLAGNPFFFNLSHSEGKILCVVSALEVGADIQCVREKRALKAPQETAMSREAALVERFFAPEEQEHWKSLSLEEQKAFFYRAWTRKEAYGKCLGVGITKVITKNITEVNTTTLQDGNGEQEQSGKVACLWDDFVWQDAYVAICLKKGNES